jgi:hypothetical protein
MEIIAAASLIQLANHFRGTQVLARPQPKIREAGGTLVDLNDIKGQESAKRALEVAAAGGHNLFMVFPRWQIRAMERPDEQEKNKGPRGGCSGRRERGTASESLQLH